MGGSTQIIHLPADKFSWNLSEFTGRAFLSTEQRAEKK